MNPRRYYSLRTGKNKNTTLSLPILLRLFKDLYIKFDREGYFQEAFGYSCVDEGLVAGTLGIDIEAQMLRTLRKVDLWPIFDKCTNYSDDDLFDVIEFLYDHISMPTDGDYHNYAGCGWHYHTFDAEVGRQKFRDEVNLLLPDYGAGFTLTEDGEIFALPESGMDNLVEAQLPNLDPDNVQIRVEAAKRKFRLYRSSIEDRRDAIRDLADVLEFLRPKLRIALHKKDETDLFNIINNFGIRHHNTDQKTDYDKAIWYSWMFYYYLATIHAATRLIQKNEIPT